MLFTAWRVSLPSKKHFFIVLTYEKNYFWNIRSLFRKYRLLFLPK